MGKVADPLQDIDDGAEAELWRRLIVDRDAAARERLIELHLPFVRIMAAKLYSGRQIREIEFDEFYQHGTIGLLESIDRFDPARGVKFRLYAASRITGAILNGIESHNEQQEQIALRSRLRKERHLSTMKQAVGGAPDERSAFARLSEIAIGMALGYMLEESGMYVNEEAQVADAAYASVELRELKRIMVELVDTLSHQERQVIRSHYFWGMGVEQIGVEMGVTKGRVSQIHRNALANLLQKYRLLYRLDQKL
jgi:RNA polymerase sigma factor for flagellar operon FliA